MSDYEVHLSGLQSLGDNLDGSAEQMDEALKWLEDASTESLGRRSLDEACTELQEDWQHGLSQIREYTGKLSDGVMGAHKLYAELDQTVANKLNGAMGGPASDDAAGGGQPGGAAPGPVAP